MGARVQTGSCARATAVAAALALGALAACAPRPAPVPEPAKQSAAMVRLPVKLPPMKVFGPARPVPPGRSNVDIARDFLDLSFRMESGNALPVMTRFQGPVSVAMTGPVPPTAPRDLDMLLARLRHEAHIPVHRAAKGRRANITIQFLPRATMQRRAPTAACFVAPRVSSWDDYLRNDTRALVDWRRLTVRDRLAVFIPYDTSPQEVRDCLNEELAQALGPIDDLYRLTDSIFNDDNFQTILTGFDMLILRAYYAPELPSGTTRAEAAARLPAILARLNPAGQHIAPQPTPAPAPHAWVHAIETALGPHTPGARRYQAARQALDTAENLGWDGPRLAFSWFVLGRTAPEDDPKTAIDAFTRAARLYDRIPGTDVQRAHVDLQMAGFILMLGKPHAALALAEHDIPVARRAQNAALLAALLMIKAQALAELGQTAGAQAARLDSLGWARYGFGTERVVRARLAEMAEVARAANGKTGTPDRNGGNGTE